MQMAPEIPTTNELAETYQLSPMAQADIAVRQAAISNNIIRPGIGSFSQVGPCAQTGELVLLGEEGQAAYDLEETESGLIVAQRLPPWKPRTDPDDWHGLETTDPELAYEGVIGQANRNSNVSIELGQPYHIDRYGAALVFAWFGGRNSNRQMKIDAALAEPSLPLGVKNDLSGEIGMALDDIKAIEDARGNDGAPAVLVYRGGENAKTPEAWAAQYEAVFEATGGRFVVDVAHGGEMAHDPKGNFNKSVAGQIACMERVLAFAEQGMAPIGLMAEASGAKSPTDPVMPHHIALDGIRRLHHIKMRVTANAR